MPEPMPTLVQLLRCVGVLACGCTASPHDAVVTPTTPGSSVPNQQKKFQTVAQASSGSAAGSVAAAPASAAPEPLAGKRIDPDGNDDAAPEGEGPFPVSGHFEKVGRAPLSLRQICDLTPFGDALYAAHSLVPLGADGAAISRYRPTDASRPFTTAFDWNRPGEPSKGGGAGQGFLRVRAIDGRLYVPDADPPYNGFGLMDWGTEGYVFVSRTDGTFAYATRPHFRPPQRPTLDGRAGAIVIPRAYHDFDVIHFRGHLVASTGAVPPKQRAWYGPSPGALHVATEDLSHFEYALSYPEPYVDGVWRLTYMVRFRDRLYAGIQDYDGRSPDDFVVVAPAPGQSELRQQDLHPVRVTTHGAAQTVRWFTDRNRLYWIAWGRDGVRLRMTMMGTIGRASKCRTARALPQISRDIADNWWYWQSTAFTVSRLTKPNWLSASTKRSHPSNCGTRSAPRRWPCSITNFTQADNRMEVCTVWLPTHLLQRRHSD